MMADDIFVDLSQSSALGGEQVSLVIQFIQKLDKKREGSDDLELGFSENDYPQAAAVSSVLRDLRHQGWNVSNTENSLQISRPKGGTSAQSEKERIRTALLINRDESLSRPSVTRFIRKMEQARQFEGNWISVFNLMADGQRFASRIQESNVEGLRPYVQLVDGSACEQTGIQLRDIWRYFRYLWSNEARSVPGRSLSFLIRDEAESNHPVIGLLALSSSVPNLGGRDEWIGWTPDVAWIRIKAMSAKERSTWVQSVLQRSADAIWIGDLVEEGILDYSFLSNPSDDLERRLRSEAEAARELHRLYPEKEILAQLNTPKTANWEEVARTSLYRYKRCISLAKQCKLNRSLSQSSESVKEDWMSCSRMRKAFGVLLREIRSRSVASRMMDLTVCGSVAPYSHVLGGKLVTMLAASPFVRDCYRKTYAGTVSIIASGKAGKPVYRKIELACVTTTSLYSVAASQYNRVSIPLHGGENGDEVLRLEDLRGLGGNTAGYGTFHFSEETVSKLARVIALSSKGRRVNSIFGEGVSPRLRKVRHGLDLLGLPSSELLRHGDSRRVYAYRLISNLQDYLLEIDDNPTYRELGDDSAFAEDIVQFWKNRWFRKRIERSEILERVQAEHTSIPVSHRARVEIPASEELSLFRNSDS